MSKRVAGLISLAVFVLFVASIAGFFISSHLSYEYREVADWVLFASVNGAIISWLGAIIMFFVVMYFKLNEYSENS